MLRVPEAARLDVLGEPLVHWSTTTSGNSAALSAVTSWKEEKVGVVHIDRPKCAPRGARTGPGACTQEG